MVERRFEIESLTRDKSRHGCKPTAMFNIAKAASQLAGEVHVHVLRLDQCREETYGQGWAWLHEEEKARARRIRHEPTRRSFVWVRSCLRALLGAYLARSPADIEFTLGDKGKPRLHGSEPDQGLVFNVSHSGDFGLIALALDAALGVDVERRREMAHRDGMAERCFADSELADWQSLEETHRQSAFFDYWSLKEAFVKATGHGITLGLEACAIELDSGSGHPRLISVPEGFGNPEQWRLVQLDMGTGHAAAVCYQGCERKLRLFDAALAFGPAKP